MTEAIFDLVTKPKGTEHEQNNAVLSQELKMKHFLEQYSRNLPTFVPVGKQANPADHSPDWIDRLFGKLSFGGFGKLT
jgi:hypothetical protein